MSADHIALLKEAGAALYGPRWQRQTKAADRFCGALLILPWPAALPRQAGDGGSHA